MSQYFRSPIFHRVETGTSPLPCISYPGRDIETAPNGRVAREHGSLEVYVGDILLRYAELLDADNADGYVTTTAIRSERLVTRIQAFGDPLDPTAFLDGEAERVRGELGGLSPIESEIFDEERYTLAHCGLALYVEEAERVMAQAAADPFVLSGAVDL